LVFFISSQIERVSGIAKGFGGIQASSKADLSRKPISKEIQSFTSIGKSGKPAPLIQG
jgi:hypothetical protein